MQQHLQMRGDVARAVNEVFVLFRSGFNVFSLFSIGCMANELLRCLLKCCSSILYLSCCRWIWFRLGLSSVPRPPGTQTRPLTFSQYYCSSSNTPSPPPGNCINLTTCPPPRWFVNVKTTRLFLLHNHAPHNKPETAASPVALASVATRHHR